MNSFSEIEILLVEDNPDDAHLTLRALEKKHLANRVFHVKDGEEALEYIFARGKYEHLAHKANPKVIFLDLKLPKIGGIEVLTEIKKNEATRNIPVVVLTSSKEEQDIVDTYNLGVNSYIVKPVDFDKFMNSIMDLGMYWLILNEPPVQKN
jgi:two-component system response regulator